VSMAPAGRESSDPTPVRVDVAADLGAARADGLTRGDATELVLAKKGRKTAEVSEKCRGRRLARHNSSHRYAVHDARPGWRRMLIRWRLAVVGFRRSSSAKSEMSAEWVKALTKTGT
jgi:hypothetical protein